MRSSSTAYRPSFVAAMSSVWASTTVTFSTRRRLDTIGDFVFGSMIRSQASAWWYTTFPRLAIMLTVLGLNMVGDSLRDLLDPRLEV